MNSIGSVAFCADGLFLLALENGVYCFDQRTGELTLFGDPNQGRAAIGYNDAKVDRQGRYWVGTLDAKEKLPRGIFYCARSAGDWRIGDSGFVVSNGPTFSPDGSRLYFSDSMGGRILVYALDTASGRLGEAEELHCFAAEEGFPDGLTVDSQGQIWCALYGGGKVVRFGAGGKLQEERRAPRSQCDELLPRRPRSADALCHHRAHAGQTGPGSRRRALRARGGDAGIAGAAVQAGGAVTRFCASDAQVFMTGCYVAIIDGQEQQERDSSAALIPWWSFTKTLIAACALRLAEQGRLALDLSLSGLPYTPRQLLQHRAGVGNYGESTDYHAAVARGDAPWSDEELFARIPPAKVLFSPGTGWAYSNVGYLLLRRLIENICGAELKDVLNEIVFSPLGLRSSRLAETPEDMAATAFEGGHGYHPAWVFHGTAIGPVFEAAQALHGILQTELLEPASRAALLNRHPIGGPLSGRPWQTTGYGLGLMIGTMCRPDTRQPLQVTGHSGGGPGSVGAVYQASQNGNLRTVAIFRAGTNGGIAENEALRLLTGCA